MLSPRGAYVTLINHNRDKSIQQARQVYLGHRALSKENKIDHHHNRYGKNINHSSNRLRMLYRSESSEPRQSSRKKFRTLGKNRQTETETSLQHTKSIKKGNSVEEQSVRQQNMRKNQLGENCRIALLQNGKTQKEYFLIVNETSEIRKLLNEKQNNNFITVPRQISLQLVMTEESISGKFLNGQCIYLKPQPKLPLINNVLSLSNYQLIRPIGSGGFSQVLLSRCKIDNRFYALKMIEKNMIVKNKKQKLVMNERNIMVNCNHPFVISLKCAFEAEKYIVFVLEYCGGGQLFGLIKKYHRLHQDTAKFYIIQILLGLQHLHSQNVVYRDIKPQNILLGTDGHVKIADLGLAKPNMENRKLAYSFCGSPQYMSPEMIMQVGHSFPVDYYCIGALLYQLLTGLPPFYNQDPEKIYQAVIEENVSYPDDVSLSSECRNLLRALLSKDPKQRLGSLYGVKQILAHPWFGKQNYQKYINKQVTPPISFTSIKHFSQTVDLELDEKSKKILQNFVKCQKKQKNDYQHVLTSFNFPEKQQCMQQKGATNKKYDKSMKIPFLPSNSRRYLQNKQDSRRLTNTKYINLLTKRSNVSQKMSGMNLHSEKIQKTCR